jgi:Holliday junction resolvasome RuvABC endonuclease subunit
MLLGLDEIPRPDDAADALAIAITDIHSSRYNAMY